MRMKLYLSDCIILFLITICFLSVHGTYDFDSPPSPPFTRPKSRSVFRPLPLSLFLRGLDAICAPGGVPPVLAAGRAPVLPHVPRHRPCRLLPTGKP